MLTLTATNVPGRNVILITAIVRIAKLSSFVRVAISVEIFAIFKLSLLSRWATRFYTYEMSKKAVLIEGETVTISSWL